MGKEPVPASGKEPEDEVQPVEVKDAKRIPVKFMEGMTVELEGYYDGEVFMATKVIMEEDV